MQSTLLNTVAKSSLLASSDALEAQQNLKLEQPDMPAIQEEGDSVSQIEISEQYFPCLKKSSLRSSEYEQIDIQAKPETSAERPAYAKNQINTFKRLSGEQAIQSYEKIAETVKQLESKVPESNFNMTEEDWTEIPNMRPSDIHLSECSMEVQQIDMDENSESGDSTRQTIQKNLSQKKFLKLFKTHNQQIQHPDDESFRFQRKDEQTQIILSEETSIKINQQLQNENLQQEHKSFEDTSEEKQEKSYQILQEPIVQDSLKVNAEMMIQYKQKKTFVSIASPDQNFFEEITSQLVSDINQYFLQEDRILLPEIKEINLQPVNQQLKTIYMNFIWERYPKITLNFFNYNTLSSRQKQDSLLNRKISRKKLQVNEKALSSQKDKKFQIVLSKMLNFFEKFSQNAATIEKQTSVSINGHAQKLNYEISKCLALLQWTVAFEQTQSKMLSKLKTLESLKDMEAYIKAKICREELKQFQQIRQIEIKQVKKKIEASIPSFFPLH